MHCPTCDSPLPVGAMFCGECGRAVTSADVAAAAARRDEGVGTGVDTSTSAEPPAWRLRQPPRPTTSGDAPWWVRDRRVEQEPVEQRPVEQRPVEANPAEQHPVEQRPAEQRPAEQSPVEQVAEDTPPAWVVPARPVDATGPDELVHDREAAAREHQDQSPSAEVAGEPELPSTAVGAGDTAAASATPPARVAPAASAPAPVPLRAPAPHPDNGPRPTSAPLWTASLTPRPSEDEAPAAHDETVAEVRAPEVVDAGASVDEPNAPRGDTARPEGEQGGASRGTTEGDAAGDEPDRSAEGPAESSSPEDETAARIDRVESAPTPDDEGVPDLEPASASASASEPAPAAVEPPGGTAAGPSSPVRLRVPAPDSTVGDTAPVVPVPRAVPGVSPAVAPVSDDGPVPLVEPGQQKVVEHCTHCGALLDEDDIFCPECGAVVQSVALSFTGPVAPLPPGWRPGATAPAPAPAAAPESEPESAPAPTPERVVDERASWARPVDEQSVEPPAAAPVEPVRRGAVPGRPADTTGRDDSAGLPELPPMPAAPATSALSGLLDDTRSRLVSDDDVDETRLVRRGPVGTEYLLQFSTGESVTVDGSGLLGRAPSPQPGERFDHLVRIADPGKSVSKTHLEFGQELGALWVSDRWSGNGTVVRPHEQPARRVEPGTRVRVARGTRVEIGEQFFIVS